MPSDSRPVSQVVLIHVTQSEHDVARGVRAASELSRSHPELRVRVIVNGSALDGLLAPGQLIPAGVEVDACSIGLGKRSIDVAGLPSGVEVVHSAVEEIALAQLAGAAYIRL